MLSLAMFQLKSNPSDKEEKEAQSQLTKSDEIQRLVAQARSSFHSQDYVTAAAQLDGIIEVRYLPCQHCLISLHYDICHVIITARCTEHLYCNECHSL